MDHTINRHYQLAVIGAGAAGLGAAVAARERGLTDILLLEKESFAGGVLRQCIHSGFFGDELEGTGPEYADALLRRADACGVRLLTDSFVTEIRRDGRVRFIRPDGVYEITAEAVILASGCMEKSAAALGIAGSRPAGVYTAGEVQRLLNVSGRDMGDDAVILGAGDIGLIAARRLTLRGKRVVRIVEKNDCPGALPKNQMLCLREFCLPLTLHSTVTAVHGRSRVESVDVTDLVSGKTENVPCSCLILAAGLVPDDALAVDSPRLLRCGNAEHVHSTVEEIARSARSAGEAAASLVLGGVPLPPPSSKPREPSALGNDETVCLLCHRGCVMRCASDALCPRGEAFFREKDGRRYCSAAVRLAGQTERLPVRTDRPVSAAQRREFLRLAENARAEGPFCVGQAVFHGDGFEAVACAASM